MSTPPPVDSPSLVLSNDPRLRQEYKSITSADLLGGATGYGEISRQGRRVELYMEWSAPSWTSGQALMNVPAWALPGMQRTLPPFYRSEAGALILTLIGSLNWHLFSAQPTTIVRCTATWRTAAP